MRKVIAIVIVALGSIIALGNIAEPDTRPTTPIGGASGEHVQQHATMTEQMRSTASGAMTVRMSGEPMWQMMRDPAHIRAEEQYQRDLDRMLARPGR